MKVLFVAGEGGAPSIRLRLIDLFGRYRAAGIKPVLLTPRANAIERVAMLRAAARHDVVVLHRVTGLSSLQLALLRRSNRHIIFDFDDALMFRDQKHGQALRPKTFAKFMRTINHCAAVVAGNEFLACFARGGDREVSVLPTAIDLAKYRRKEERLGRGNIIGWMGLSDGFRYLEQIAPALRRLGELFPALRLKIVSDKPLSLHGVRIENEVWRLENEQANLAAFDVGIMPLADSAWTRGKCSYKILQYMGVGTAVVASPVGMNAEVITPGENGFLARSQDDWVNSLATLIDDAALRSAFGERGRQLVEQRFSLDQFAEAYLRLLREVASA